MGCGRAAAWHQTAKHAPKRQARKARSVEKTAFLKAACATSATEASGDTRGLRGAGRPRRQWVTKTWRSLGQVRGPAVGQRRRAGPCNRNGFGDMGDADADADAVGDGGEQSGRDRRGWVRGWRGVRQVSSGGRARPAAIKHEIDHRGCMVDHIRQSKPYSDTISDVRSLCGGIEVEHGVKGWYVGGCGD